jgi:hypothetical protein
VRSNDAGATWKAMARPITRHDTSRDSAPAALEGTPRAEPASAAAATTDITGRKVLFAVLCALAALVALWLLERVTPRWRWPVRIVAALAVFAGVLWLLVRR